MVGVTGSIPVAPTTIFPSKSSRDGALAQRRLDRLVALCTRRRGLSGGGDAFMCHDPPNNGWPGEYHQRTVDVVVSPTSIRMVPSWRDVMSSSPSRVWLMKRSARAILESIF
jgi:hypothetical protein